MTNFVSNLNRLTCSRRGATPLVCVPMVLTVIDVIGANISGRRTRPLVATPRLCLAGQITAIGFYGRIIQAFQKGIGCHPFSARFASITLPSAALQRRLLYVIWTQPISHLSFVSYRIPPTSYRPRIVIYRRLFPYGSPVSA